MDHIIALLAQSRTELLSALHQHSDRALAALALTPLIKAATELHDQAVAVGAALAEDVKAADTAAELLAEVRACDALAQRLDSLSPEVPGSFTGTPSERIRRQLANFPEIGTVFQPEDPVLSPEDLKTLRHALGAIETAPPHEWGHRNYIAVSDGQLGTMERLVAGGFLRRGVPTLSLTLFHVTEAGMDAAGLDAAAKRRALASLEA